MPITAMKRPPPKTARPGRLSPASGKGLAVGVEALGVELALGTEVTGKVGVGVETGQIQSASSGQSGLRQ
jgi:hypothetical protein